MLKLSDQSLKLLEYCLKENRPDLLWVIKENKDIAVDEVLGNELREAVGDELIKAGFNGDVPNEFGIKLEELIDEIGRLFME